MFTIRNIQTFLIFFVSFYSLQTLINMAYCCLILVGKSIQKIVFGDLRISEQQHLKDKFWSFVFYKFIFIFGVINVQFMHEVSNCCTAVLNANLIDWGITLEPFQVILWIAWFSILGFLHLLSQLCKDRFEYVSKNLVINCRDSLFIGARMMTRIKRLSFT